jgi:hypothetical protein
VDANERAVQREELRWGAVVAGMVAFLLAAILYAGLLLRTNPPSNIELLDPNGAI